VGPVSTPVGITLVPYRAWHLWTYVQTAPYFRFPRRWKCGLSRDATSQPIKPQPTVHFPAQVPLYVLWYHKPSCDTLSPTLGTALRSSRASANPLQTAKVWAGRKKMRLVQELRVGSAIAALTSEHCPLGNSISRQ
jgi:hypothetical protein